MDTINSIRGNTLASLLSLRERYEKVLSKDCKLMKDLDKEISEAYKKLRKTI